MYSVLFFIPLFTKQDRPLSKKVNIMINTNLDMDENQ